MSSSYETGAASSEARLLDDQFFDLIGRVATGEAKLVIANRFAAEPGQDFKAREIMLAIDEFVPEGWVPSWPTISGYCKSSLEPAKVVRRTRGDGAYGSHYQATPYGSSIGLGLGGVVNAWSLETPDVSTHQVFGVNKPSGAQASTQYRYQVVSYLVDKKDAVASSDIVEDLDHSISLSTTEKHIAALKQAGLITYVNKEQTYNPTFVLGEPKPRYGKIKQASTVQLYKTLEKLYANNTRQVSLDDILEQTLANAGPDTDPVKLRQTLTAAATRKLNIPCLTATEPVRYRHSKIALKEQYRDSMRSLIDSLDEFKADPNRSSFRRTGLEIVSDGDSVRQLFDKWENTSAKVKAANSQEITKSKAEIVAIIGQLGRACLPDIYSALEEQGSTLSRATIRKRVIDLAEAKTLSSHAIKTDQTKNVVREYFEVAAPNEATQSS